MHCATVNVRLCFIILALNYYNYAVLTFYHQVFVDHAVTD